MTIDDSKHQWQRLAAGVSLALCCSCGSGTPPADSPSRSPSLDYQEPARGAGDGEVLGADKQAPADRLQVGLTNEHAAHNSSLEKPAPMPSASASAASQAY
jgi:hypothetical protein